MGTRQLPASSRYGKDGVGEGAPAWLRPVVERRGRLCYSCATLSPDVRSPPRLRFAPSPTGYLHIGGVRTALFNWLWARKSQGTFVLRIEDTDRERSTEASRKVILDSLAWLGLDWDEGPGKGGPHGPYTQMERLPLYKEMSERLIREGNAFRCFCTKQELDAQREVLKKVDPKAHFRYPGTCRDRRDEPSSPFVVRFKAPAEGSITYVDKVFGEVTTPNAAQQDFVLLRSDGVPLYNFGAVVDDVTMGITLVARGRDHMVNTPPQIMLYKALGAKVPEFAHLPMMLAPSGEKLSKRHGAVSVGEYRDQGYSPMAVLNYLVRFGWSSGDEEVFSREELIAKFDWADCGRADGKFDKKKFLAINYEHLKSPTLMPDAEYARRVAPFLAKRGIEHFDEALFVRALPTIRDRAHTFEEAADLLDFFLRDEPVIDEKAAAKALVGAAAAHLHAMITMLGAWESWDEASLDAGIKAWALREGLDFKDVASPARVALTGRSASPSLHQVLSALGKDLSLARLEKAARRAELAK
jgi:glutamyl-tRNA synthetase